MLRARNGLAPAALTAMVAAVLCAGGSLAAVEEPSPEDLLLGPEPLKTPGGQAAEPAPSDPDPQTGEPGDARKEKASGLLELAAEALGAETAPAGARAHVALARGRVEQALKILEPAKGVRQGAKSTVLRALALIRAGESGEAAGLLREAAALIESKGSLTLRNLSFADRVCSFGVWDRAEAVFRPGQRVMTYCEVLGFACVKHGPGEYSVRLKIALAIDRDDGSHVIQSLRDDLVKHRTKSRIHDLHPCTRFDIPAGLSPGKYILRAKVTDRSTGAVASAGVPFEVTNASGGER